MYVPRAMYSLRMSFCSVPADGVAADALLAGHGDVHGQQDRRRGVDGHGGGDPVQGDALEQHFEVRQRIDGHPDLAHLSGSQRVLAVSPHLGGKIERHRQAGLSPLQQVAEPGVGVPGRGEPGVLAHGPQAPLVHGWIHAPGERWPAGIADLLQVVAMFGGGRVVENVAVGVETVIGQPLPQRLLDLLHKGRWKGGEADGPTAGPPAEGAAEENQSGYRPGTGPAPVRDSRRLRRAPTIRKVLSTTSPRGATALL